MKGAAKLLPITPKVGGQEFDIKHEETPKPMMILGDSPVHHHRVWWVLHAHVDNLLVTMQKDPNSHVHDPGSYASGHEHGN